MLGLFFSSRRSGSADAATGALAYVAVAPTAADSVAIALGAAASEVARAVDTEDAVT